MSSFAFIISLAAVINGLGMVRLLSAFSEYLRCRSSLNVQHYWVFSLFAAFQFLVHILLWWTFWGTHDAGVNNFLVYLYLLAGPILLYLGTSLLVPDVKNEIIDLKKHYFDIYRSYSTVSILFWLWAIFLRPVLRDEFAPAVSIFVLYLIMAVAMRVTANPKVHAAMVVFGWTLLIVFIATFAMQLEGIGQ